jgi:transcriptional regulator with XRE-family HTH domain
MQTKHEFLENLRITMERERMLLRYSQVEMARALDLSLSSYKRIVNGESHKIGIYTLYRMQQLTGKLMDELCQADSPYSALLPLLRQLSEQQRLFVQSVLEFEVRFATALRKGRSVEDYVTLIIPSGNMCDGMIYDSCSFDKINISACSPRFRDSIACGILVTSSHLQPVYQPNDILLIGRGPIRDGDTGIFFDNTTGLAYVRKFYQTEPNRLEPVTNYGQTFYLDNNSREDTARWTKFGCVLSKLRV